MTVIIVTNTEERAAIAHLSWSRYWLAIRECSCARGKDVNAQTAKGVRRMMCIICMFSKRPLAIKARIRDEQEMEFVKVTK